jgi:hypothetical protein
MRIILAVFLLGFSFLAVHGQKPSDAGELTRLLNEFLDGAGRNDAAIHDRFWADELIYTRGIGQRIGKAELMQGVRSAATPKQTDPVTVYSAEDVRILQYGKTAVVAFKLAARRVLPDGSSSVSYHLNTGTFIKRNGRWQAVAWQATSVPAE